MVIGPPQTGKTTLLRDVARCMSQGVSASEIPSCKVGSLMNGQKLLVV